MYGYYVQGMVDEDGILLPGKQLDEDELVEYYDSQPDEPEREMLEDLFSTSPLRQLSTSHAPTMSQDPGRQPYAS